MFQVLILPACYKIVGYLDGRSKTAKTGCIHSPLVHVTSAKSPQITPLLDTNEVLGECKT